MSEFHDDESVSRTRSNRTAQPIVRGVLFAVLVGLWVAVGTGHLNSSTPGISHLRSVFSLDASHSEGTSQLPAGVPSVQSSGSPVFSDAHANITTGQNPSAAPMTTDSKSPTAASPSAVVASSASAPSSAAAPVGASVQGSAQAGVSAKERSVTASVMTTSKVDLSMQTQAEIETMARLFLAQLEQFNATEEHLVQVVNAHASSSERAAFLATLQKQHEAALSKLQGKRQNSAP